MKRQRVTALLLSAVLSLTFCVPQYSMPVFAEENSGSLDPSAGQEQLSGTAEGTQADDFGESSTEAVVPSAVQDDENEIRPDSDAETDAESMADAEDPAAQDAAAAENRAQDQRDQDAETAENTAQDRQNQRDQDGETAEDTAQNQQDQGAEAAENNAHDQQNPDAEAAENNTAQDQQDPDAVPSEDAAQDPSNAAEASQRQHDSSADSTPSGQEGKETQDKHDGMDVSEDSPVIAAPDEKQTEKTDPAMSLSDHEDKDLSSAAVIRVGDTPVVSIDTEDRNVFFRFTPNEDGSYIFYSSDNTCDPRARLIDADGNDSKEDDDGGEDDNFRITVRLSAGETCYLQVCAFGEETGEYTLHLEKTSLSLSYVTDSFSEIIAGEEVTLQVSAASDSNVTYEWMHDGTTIDGVTGPTYTFTPEESGAYFCSAVNENGDTDLLEFQINVLTFSAAPLGDTDLITRPGIPVTLKVDARSESILHYAWSIDGEPVGTDSANFTYTPEEPEYIFVICYVYDENDNAAFLYYSVDSRILAVEPVGDTVKTISSGEEVTLGVTARSDAPVSYQWYIDEVPVEGATAATYTFTPSEPTKASCLVSDEDGYEETVDFSISFTLPFSVDFVGDQTRYVKKGDNVTLEVSVSADPGTELTYSWQDKSNDTDFPFDSSQPFKITLTNIQNHKSIGFLAEDNTGNGSYLEYSIVVEEIPAVYPFGENIGCTSATCFMDPGDSVYLSVDREDYSKEYICRWYDEDSNTLLDSTDFDFVFDMGDTVRHFRCRVTDANISTSVIDLYFTVKPTVPVAEDYAGAQAIKVGDIKPVSVTKDTPFAVFTFKPLVTGEYSFYSSDSDGDPCVSLFDADHNPVYAADDSGENRDFLLTEDFEAGTTWYVAVYSSFPDSPADFRIHLEGPEPSQQEQILTAGDISLVYKSTKKINVTGAQGTLHFESSDPAVASVDADGIVTAKKAGSAKITISAEGTDNYLPSEEIEITATVTRASLTVENVTLSATNYTYDGKEKRPGVTVKYDNAALTAGTDYTVSYNANKNAGTASVTVSGQGNYTGSVTKTFTIKRAAQNLTLTAAASSIYIGKTTTVKAGGAKETASYTYASSNASVASVSANGTVTAKKAGTVTITAKTARTTNYEAGSKTVTIKVTALKKPGYCHFFKWNNTAYSSCNISWNSAEGADGYQTHLSWTNGSHSSTSYVGRNVLTKQCSVTVNHVSQFQVRAYINGVNGKVFGPWSNIEYITPSPTQLKTTNQSSGSDLKMKIAWNIIYGSNGYNVFLTTNPNGEWYWNQSTSVEANATNAVITKYRGSKLKKGTRYYVRIVTRRKRNGVFCTVPMPSASTNIGSFVIK